MSYPREPREVPPISGSAQQPLKRRLKWPAFPEPARIEWICLIGGLFLTIHYSWIMDDAYVYFRYVDNLLFLNRGLVFNAGEYVEGFSSPLWMLLLIALRATGLNYWIITRLAGLAAFIVFWMLLVVLNRRLSPPQSRPLNIPLCYLAFNYGVLCYFTSGLEAPLVHVAAALCALFVLNPASRALQLLLALAPLARHELVIPFAMCLVWAWVRQRKFPLLMTCAGLLITGAWVVFRIYYYADLFPNTFYLKDMTDVRQGLIYLQETAGTYWLYPLLAAFVLLLLIGIFKKPARARTEPPQVPDTLQTGWSLEIRKRLLMLALAAPIAIYVIRIGGDPRHYRFLAFPFCLCLCACSGIAEQVLARFSLRVPRLLTTALGVLVAMASVSLYPPQLSAHPFFGKEQHSKVNKIADASVHRHDRRLAQPPWGTGAEMEIKGQYPAFRQQHLDGAHTQLQIGSGCAWMYKVFAARHMQALGLTDPILARTEMKADRPAHKEGLRPLAKDLAQIINQSRNSPHKGMYREAVDRGTAPQWIADNLNTIEIIEQKMFNTHDFIHNLRLAFAFPDKIKLPAQR